MDTVPNWTIHMCKCRRLQYFFSFFYFQIIFVVLMSLSQHEGNLINNIQIVLSFVICSVSLNPITLLNTIRFVFSVSSRFIFGESVQNCKFSREIYADN